VLEDFTRNGNYMVHQLIVIKDIRGWKSSISSTIL